MADESVKFKIDFDTKDGLENIEKLHKTLESIGEVESFGKLISTMKNFLGPLALVAAAIYSIKEAMDLVMEGENVKRVELQFNSLAESAGIVGEKLKLSIEKAKGPTVDLDDALKASTEAIVKLGLNADRIPEIFELARKVARVFGGEVTDRFDQITQAISTGNQRFIKSIGLQVDIDEATKKYAASLGKTVTSLTEFEKQQALMNAVLEGGSTKFRNISLNSDELGTKVKTLGVAWKELGESIAKLMTSLAPYINPVIEKITQGVEVIRHFIEGIGKEDIKELSSKLIEIQKERDRLNKELTPKLIHGDDTTEIMARLKKLREEYEKTQSKIEELSPKKEGEAKKESTPQEIAAEKNKLDLIATERKKARDKEELEENKFQSSLLQMKQANLNESLQFMQTEDEALNNINAQMVTTAAIYSEKIKQIENERDINKTISAQNAALMIAQIEEERVYKIQTLAEKEKDIDQLVADNKVRLAKGGLDEFTKASEAANLRARKDMLGMEGVSKQVSSNFGSNFGRAFANIGAGSNDAAKEMGDAFAGMVGDMAGNYGQMLLSTSIWPLNPAGLAAGAALMALSGMLRGRGKSAGGETASGGGGGIAPSTITSPAPNVPQAEKGKSVTLQVMGNYFETQETQKQIMEMIRKESDATDFKYQQIGVR